MKAGVCTSPWPVVIVPVRARLSVAWRVNEKSFDTISVQAMYTLVYFDVGKPYMPIRGMLTNNVPNSNLPQTVHLWPDRNFETFLTPEPQLSKIYIPHGESGSTQLPDQLAEIKQAYSEKLGRGQDFTTIHVVDHRYRTDFPTEFRMGEERLAYDYIHIDDRDIIHLLESPIPETGLGSSLKEFVNKKQSSSNDYSHRRDLLLYVYNSLKIQYRGREPLEDLFIANPITRQIRFPLFDEDGNNHPDMNPYPEEITGRSLDQTDSDKFKTLTILDHRTRKNVPFGVAFAESPEDEIFSTDRLSFSLMDDESISYVKQYIKAIDDSNISKIYFHDSPKVFAEKIASTLYERYLEDKHKFNKIRWVKWDHNNMVSGYHVELDRRGNESYLRVDPKHFHDYEGIKPFFGPITKNEHNAIPKVVDMLFDLGEKPPSKIGEVLQKIGPVILEPILHYLEQDEYVNQYQTIEEDRLYGLVETPHEQERFLHYAESFINREEVDKVFATLADFGEQFPYGDRDQAARNVRTTVLKTIADTFIKAKVKEWDQSVKLK
jgi:hypothetical protein